MCQMRCTILWVPLTWAKHRTLHFVSVTRETSNHFYSSFLSCYSSVYHLILDVKRSCTSDRQSSLPFSRLHRNTTLQVFATMHLVQTGELYVCVMASVHAAHSGAATWQWVRPAEISRPPRDSSRSSSRHTSWLTCFFSALFCLLSLSALHFVKHTVSSVSQVSGWPFLCSLTIEAISGHFFSFLAPGVVNTVVRTPYLVPYDWRETVAWRKKILHLLSGHK